MLLQIVCGTNLGVCVVSIAPRCIIPPVVSHPAWDSWAKALAAAAAAEAEGGGGLSEGKEGEAADHERGEHERSFHDRFVGETCDGRRRRGL